MQAPAKATRRYDPGDCAAGGGSPASLGANGTHPFPVAIGTEPKKFYANRTGIGLLCL